MSDDEHKILQCYRQRVPIRDEIELHAGDGSAGYKNLIQCGRIWHCPVCSRRESEKRRAELQQAIINAKAHGLRVAMLTLTLSHNRDESLLDVKTRARTAWNKFAYGSGWQNIADDFGYVGRVRALEVTHGSANGWHVHFHVLLFLDLDYGYDLDELEQQFKSLWCDRVSRSGGYASHEHGAKLTERDSAIGEYVTKFGTLPQDSRKKAENDAETGWNESHEVAKAINKVSHNRHSNGDGDKGRTPFALLEDFSNGDYHAGELYREYAHAMHRDKQLSWSSNLKKLLLEQYKSSSDGDELGDDKPNRHLVAAISDDLWREVVRQQQRGKLLDIAAADEQAARAHLAEIAKHALIDDTERETFTLGAFRINTRGNQRTGYTAAVWARGSYNPKPQWVTPVPLSQAEARGHAIDYVNDIQKRLRDSKARRRRELREASLFRRPPPSADG